MKGLSVSALLLAAALAGCSSPAKPLDLPDPEDVGVLEITRWKGKFWERHEISTQYDIRDRRRIAEILALLEKEGATYWRRPFSGPWSHDYTIDVWSKPGATDFYLHVGERSFGGSERDQWPAADRERRLSAEERKRLLELIAREDP